MRHPFPNLPCILLPHEHLNEAHAVVERADSPMMQGISQAMKRGYQAVFGIPEEERSSKLFKSSEDCACAQDSKVFDAAIPFCQHTRTIDQRHSKADGSLAAEDVEDKEERRNPSKKPISEARQDEEAEDPEFHHRYIYVGPGASRRADSESAIVTIERDGKVVQAITLTPRIQEVLKAFVSTEVEVIIARKHAKRKETTLDKFCNYANHEIEDLKQQYWDLGSSEDDIEKQRVLRMWRALTKKLSKAQEERQALKEDLRQAEEEANDARKDAAKMLNRLLEEVEVFTPADDDSDDDQKEAKEQELEAEYAVPVSEGSSRDDVDSDSKASPVTDAREEYLACLDKLNAAELRFDNRKSAHEGERRELLRRPRGGEDVTQRLLDVDRKHFLKGQKLTRDLIKAEEDFQAAKVKAVRLRADILTSDMSSGFGSRIEGDQRASGSALSGVKWDERGPQKHPSILTWTQQLPNLDDSVMAEQMRRRSVPEIDHWSPATVGMHESSSMVGKDRRKRRIERVKAANEALRESAMKHYQRTIRKRKRS